MNKRDILLAQKTLAARQVKIDSKVYSQNYSINTTVTLYSSWSSYPRK